MTELTKRSAIRQCRSIANQMDDDYRFKQTCGAVASCGLTAVTVAQATTKDIGPMKRVCSFVAACGTTAMSYLLVQRLWHTHSVCHPNRMYMEGPFGRVAMYEPAHWKITEISNGLYRAEVTGPGWIPDQDIRVFDVYNNGTCDVATKVKCE